MTPQELITDFVFSKYDAATNTFLKLNFMPASDWLVANAGRVNVDIKAMQHQITTDFISHTLKSHGDAVFETRRGNIAITKQDFSYIADIVSAPTFAVFGVTRDGADRIIYVKELADGTALYFEEILTGNRNRVLRGKSLSKQKNKITVERLRNILLSNQRNDTSKMIIAFGVAANSTFDHS